jgi:hypothetical protein
VCQRASHEPRAWSASPHNTQSVAACLRSGYCFCCPGCCALHCIALRCVALRCVAFVSPCPSHVHPRSTTAPACPCLQGGRRGRRLCTAARLVLLMYSSGWLLRGLKFAQQPDCAAECPA